MIISIEGNIGSGKTTILSMLKSKMGDYLGRGRPIVYVKEPVEDWEKIKDEEGKSMLDLLYSDAKTHSFAFQMMAFITRLNALKEARKENPGAILITERCLQTDAEVFAKMLRNSGDIMNIHWKIYNEWSKSLSTEWEPNLIVYVRAEPETSLARVKIRGRESEASISLDYLTKCHEAHEEWLGEVDKERKIVFDGNDEFVGEKEFRVDELIKQILGIC
jgi:deoxycitidine kinase/deoxyguanosine kinase